MPLLSPPLPGLRRPPPVPLPPPLRPAVTPRVAPVHAPAHPGRHCRPLPPPLHTFRAPHGHHRRVPLRAPPSRPATRPPNAVGVQSAWHVAVLLPPRRPPSAGQRRPGGTPPRAPLHPQHDAHIASVTPPPRPLPRHRPAPPPPPPPPLPPHVPTPPCTQPHTLRHSIALVWLLRQCATWRLTVDRRPVVPLPLAPLPGPHPAHMVFAPTTRAADILPPLAATPPGQRILLAANPSVLSEVLIGHAHALHVRPLLPDLHVAYAPGTPVDPSVWDSQRGHRPPAGPRKPPRARLGHPSPWTPLPTRPTPTSAPEQRSPPAAGPTARRGPPAGTPAPLRVRPPQLGLHGALAPYTPSDPTVWGSWGLCRPPAGPPAAPSDRHGPRTRSAACRYPCARPRPQPPGNATSAPQVPRPAEGPATGTPAPLRTRPPQYGLQDAPSPGTPTDPTLWGAQGHCRPQAGPPASPRDRHGPRTRMAPRPTRPPAATHAPDPGLDPPPAVPRGLPYSEHRDRHQGTTPEPNTARQQL